jgi:hypothetical protein
LLRNQQRQQQWRGLVQQQGPLNGQSQAAWAMQHCQPQLLLRRMLIRQQKLGRTMQQRPSRWRQLQVGLLMVPMAACEALLTAACWMLV